MIVLTRAGIEEMRRSRQAPDQATGHFPPISVIHAEGDAIGSAIQAGSRPQTLPGPDSPLLQKIASRHP
jgi:hypothetical protein